MRNKNCDVISVPHGIWTAPSVSDQPVIKLARWAVFEVETGDRFLVGFNVNDQEGRVSTPINTFDSVAGLVITTSGRTYHLVGPAGCDPDGHWIWTHLMEVRKMRYREVTHEYLSSVG